MTALRRTQAGNDEKPQQHFAGLITKLHPSPYQDQLENVEQRSALQADSRASCQG